MLSSYQKKSTKSVFPISFKLFHDAEGRQSMQGLIVMIDFVFKKIGIPRSAQ